MWPGVHALVTHRVAHVLDAAGVPVVPRLLAAGARAFTGVEIHPAASVGGGLFIDHGSGVVIGETAEIGENVTIYQGVTLGGTTLVAGTKRHPTLERGVIVGAGAQVLGAFTVGEYAKIGSNAVVIKPVPSGATAVGNPAHIIRKEDQSRSAHLFAAYGVTPNGDDPLSKALRALVDHVARQDEQIERLTNTMREAGLCCPKVREGDKLDSEQLNRLVD
jgi:serine O-acetyltransferase